MAILLSLVMLVVQTVGVSHAAAHGDGPHDHGGIECIIAKAGGAYDDDWDTPPEMIASSLPRIEAATSSFALKALLIPTVTVTPPGRAPPLS